MMGPILLVSAAILAVEPQPVVGIIVANPNSRSFVRFWPERKTEVEFPTVEAPYQRIDDGMIAIYLGEYTIRRECEPDRTIGADDAIGHRVRIMPPGESNRGLIEVLGGIPERRYAATIKHPGPVLPRDAALVARGLGSPRYATREAARDVLVRQGEGSIPALLGGLRSADAEVRDRCRWCLDEIRTGIRD